MDEMHRGRQDAVGGEDTGGVAGHENEAELGVLRAQLFRKIQTVHARHHDVGQQEVDLAGMSPREAQAVARGGGREYLVPEALQYHAAHEQNGWLVLHEQDGLAAATCEGDRPRLGAGGGGLCVPGQVNTEGRAAARLARDIDEAVVLPDNTLDRRKAEPGAPAGILRGEEGLEHVRE